MARPCSKLAEMSLRKKIILGSHVCGVGLGVIFDTDPTSQLLLTLVIIMMINDDDNIDSIDNRLRNLVQASL